VAATAPAPNTSGFSVSADSPYNFAGNLLGGGRYSGTEHRQRPLVVWFWAQT